MKLPNSIETQLEQALEASQSRFSRLAANVPGVIYQFILHSDGSQEFSYVSPGCEEIYEVEPKQFIENTAFVMGMIHVEDQQRFQDSVVLSARTLQPWNYQWRILTPSGQLKWLQGFSRPDKVKDDIVWDGMFIDITERKQAEIKQKQVEWELKKSEAQFRALAKRESLFNALATQIRKSLELDTILETAIAQIRLLLQIDRCHFSWYEPDRNPPVFRVVKEDKEEVVKSVLGVYRAKRSSLLTQKIIVGEEIRVDDISSCPDPKLRKFLKHFGFNSVFILSIRTQGGAVGILSCGNGCGLRPWHENELELVRAVVDQLAIAINQAELYQQTQQAAVKAQKQAQESQKMLQELKQTQGQLIQREKLSSLGQLVAGVAHEINNPVNFIYGNLTHAKGYIFDLVSLIELYQQVYPEPHPKITSQIENIELDFLLEDLPQLFKSMEVGAERIREIVKSLRNFSRSDEADMKVVDIHEGIDSTLMILQSRLKARSDRPGIELIKEYGDLPQVSCYPGQLNQVFMNLVSNSIDALEAYDEKRSQAEMQVVPSQIKIATTVGDKQDIIIKIVDNGQGIAESVQTTLFDPFVTTKAIGKGTGLGLSISYQIITEKHGGTISCNSLPGKGAEFVIKIPTQRA